MHETVSNPSHAIICCTLNGAVDQ
ncbi:hypothetical protein AZE42_12122 [Rhizopogon vesiculosus]|uniref:Uncharacterized protein n=1 Tax=Rhizopogon vesiculosus TaxID=180088 RepID=A0A1J8PUE0_9AGAM|nr:hypothetical protein AZE42_12122 [Rhizopogon vesiculosus]